MCAECRRRKIACDRNAPCAQCVQAHLKCAYYNSYAHSDFQIDRHNSANSKPRSSSSASSTQATHQGYGTEPPSESLGNVDYQRNFSSVSNLDVASAIPAAISVDTSAPSWLETEIYGTLSQPLSTAFDASALALFSPDPVAALSDADPEAGRPALPPPPLHTESNSAEPGNVLSSKSRMYGPTHWMTILRKVRFN